MSDYDNWETLVHFVGELEGVELGAREAIADAMLNTLNRELRHQRQIRKLPETDY